MTARSLRIMVLLLVPLALVPGSMGHDGIAGHGHLFVSLGDDSRTAEVEPDDQIGFRYAGSLPVVADEEGRATIRFAMPDQAVLQRFAAPGLDNVTELALADIDGIPHAVRTWGTDGPAMNSTIHNVTFAAARQVDPRGTIAVRWTGLDRFDELSVRVEVPQRHVVSSGRDLVAQVHDGGSRAVWSQHDFDSRTLEFSVRPASAGANPAHSDPPHPLGAWFLLLGIALVAGGAWFVGKKLETREHP